MDESPHPRRRKASRRQEILTAARQVFVEHSYERASVSEIAARAGCVEGTLYTYFRNKRDLLDSVLADFYDALIAEIGPHFGSIQGTRDRLGYLVARHLQITVDDPGMGRLIREARAADPYFGSKLHGLNRRYSQFLIQTIEDGIGRGELRADLDVTVARDLLFGGLEHVSSTRLGRGRRFDPSKMAREIASQFLDGWGGAPRDGGNGSGNDDLARRLDRVERRLDRLDRALEA